MNNTRILLVILLVLMLSTCLSAQRGGVSRSRSRSSSRGFGINNLFGNESIILNSTLFDGEINIVKNVVRSFREWIFGKQSKHTFDRHYAKFQWLYETPFVISTLFLAGIIMITYDVLRKKWIYSSLERK